MVMLATSALGALAVTGLLLWWALTRLWHVAIIAVITIALYPAVVIVTGDVSRYLPDSAFADGIEGKDQIVVASAAATLIVALALAALLLGTARIGWHRFTTRR